MKRSILIAVLLAVAATVWVASGQLGGDGGEPEAVKPPTDLSAKAIVPKVRIRTLEAQSRQAELFLSGTTEADRKVPVRAEVSGQVVELAVEPGDQVSAGDLLVRLDDEDRPAMVAQAKALVAQKEFDYQAAKSLAGKGYRAETQLAAAAAELEAARATLQRSELDLANTRITAPFDGIVDTRPVELGAYVDRSDAIATLVDIDPIVVSVYVSERQVDKVSLGQTGTARLATGQTVSGTVGYIAAVADANTRTFRTELNVPNPNARLVEGMTAEVVLPLNEVPAHFVSPAILSLSDDGIVGVKSVDDDNKIVFMPVEILGDEPDGMWLGGLPDQVVVVTVGQEFVRVGQEVDPVRDDGELGTPLQDAPKETAPAISELPQ